MDLNTAITVYFSDRYRHVDNRALRELCADNERADRFAAEIRGLDTALWELAVEQAGEGTLSDAAIEQLAREYVAATGLPVYESGFQKLLQNLLYGCLHNGYLE